LKNTPIHPQWLILRNKKRSLAEISQLACGKILDIGAGTRKIEEHLASDCEYISLDYMDTAINWYHTRPHIYGDAQRLPIKDGVFDTVLLLDVLEHLPEPEEAIREAKRVLRKEGALLVQTPFLYPIHDAPHDYQRWTSFGLRQLAKRYGFDIEKEWIYGSPLETAGLLMNLALSREMLYSFRHKSFAIPAIMALLVFMPLFQLVLWLLSLTSSGDKLFMPYSIRMVWRQRS